jgi:predicted DNA-binding transcriptional regulator AlpA
MERNSERTAFSEGELARQLKISRGALRKWRRARQGPRFLRLGKCIRYLDADVAAWLEGHASDQGAVRV